MAKEKECCYALTLDLFCLKNFTFVMRLGLDMPFAYLILPKIIRAAIYDEGAQSHTYQQSQAWGGHSWEGLEPKELFWQAVVAAAVAVKAARSHLEEKMGWTLPVIALMWEQKRLAVAQVQELWAVQGCL